MSEACCRAACCSGRCPAALASFMCAPTSRLWPAAKSPPPMQPDEAVLSLMRTLCEEMHLLACEIVQLGESLSDEYAEQPAMRMRDLQSFDMISQNAVAQARLLKGVERRLSGLAPPDNPDITALIEAVPFQDVRRRLLASF